MRHARHDGEVIGYPVHHVNVGLEEREILYEDPVDRIRTADRGEARRGAVGVDKALGPDRTKHRRLRDRRIVEISRQHDTFIGPCLALLIPNHLVQLLAAQRVVTAAFEVGGVDQHPAGARSQRHPAAAPRLYGIQPPAQAGLLGKDQDAGVRNRISTQDRLAVQRRAALRPFPDLLKLASEDPVHSERGREIGGHVAPAAAIAIAIHFLQQQHIRIELLEGVEHARKAHAALDVPRDHSEPVREHGGGRDRYRASHDCVNVVRPESRLGEEAGQASK